MKNFKKILFPLVLGLFAFAQINAQDEYAAENEGWYVNIDEAYAESQETGKPILANFTGSDWCHWCKKLTAAVFVHDEFKNWAKENVILLELDFPRRKKLPENIRGQNASLQQAFGVRGYPTVWLFDLEKDPGGKFMVSALGKTGYNKTVPEFTGAIEQMIAQRKK